MYTIRKVFKFEAAHVLDSSYSEDCQEIHGHSYIVEVFCRCNSLNEDGMVVDFGNLKDTVKPIIDEWDHALIISDRNSNDFSNYKVVKVAFNPTAEFMANYLYWKIKPAIPFIYKVRVHETSTGYAEYER